MRKMIKKSDSLYQFQDTIQFSIMPLLKFGQTFVYDENNEINAVISYQGIETIFGIEDSIKHISLSNGKIIKISKNFGIIEFQEENSEYNLVGLKNNILYGEDILTFKDFFEYEVGDVFQRYSDDWSSGDDFCIDEITSKYKINSKFINGDTIRYDISGWKLHYHRCNGNNEYIIAYQFLDMITYIDSLEHFIHKYPNELIDLNYYDGMYGNEIMLNRVEYLTLNNRKVIKSGSFCDEAGESYEDFPFYKEYSQNSDLLVRNVYGGPDEIEFKYIESCGESFGCFCFEYGGCDIFVGKIHNGEVIGTVYPDSYFEQYSNIEENKEQGIIIYPNPINKNENLKIITDLKFEKYKIIDISGKIILNGDFNSCEIPININTPGIYILELIIKDKIIRKKIIIN